MEVKQGGKIYKNLNPLVILHGRHAMCRVRGLTKFLGISVLGTSVFD